MAGERELVGCVALFFSICVRWNYYTNEVSNFPFPREGGERLPQAYDFIIGGGRRDSGLRAGQPLDRKWEVLLEAGGIPPEFMYVPGLAERNQVMPEITFQYQSVPQKRAALGLNGGVIDIPLGRILGGTSMINHNMFNRGHPLDYDNWAKVTGDPSWEYANMLPYFRKAESYFGEFPSTIHHGFDGPVTVCRQKYAPGAEAFLDAAQELGFPILDPNGPQQISFHRVEFSRRNGRRVGSYDSYLEPIMNSRDNLRVVINAYVTKVLFSGSSAMGVMFNQNGTYPVIGNVAVAKREVILSAGAYGSATLLMRSGIGLREVLHPAGIPVIKELPVGENFQEHPILPIHFILNNRSMSINRATDLNPRTLELFQRYGDGPYTSVAGFVAQGYLASSVAIREGQPNWPDIQFRLSSITTRLDPYNGSYVEPWEASIVMNAYLAREYSRGSVRLNPADIYGTPIIDFNYFDDPRDVDVYLEAVQVILNLFERTEAYQRLGARMFEPLPACGHFPPQSESYWRCYISQIIQPGNHPSGTCAMNSVVDSRLRVIGISRLRVVDASIMPYITDSNIQAAVYGIAEKASDTILLDQF